MVILWVYSHDNRVEEMIWSSNEMYQIMTYFHSCRVSPRAQLYELMVIVWVYSHDNHAIEIIRLSDTFCVVYTRLMQSIIF